MIPTIAILMSYKDSGTYIISANYALCVMAVHSRYVYITPKAIDEQLDTIKPDGIILPGGDFPFDPSYYVDKSFYEGAPDERFESYKKTIEHSIKREIPLLGICAGMQVLAGYLGGKITSNITGHRQCKRESAHTVRLASSLTDTVGVPNKIMVNSRHNETVAPNYPGDFKIVGKTAKGVIEAIEPKNKWAKFVLGVQWHPEDLALKSYPHMAIFDAFADAARNR